MIGYKAFDKDLKCRGFQYEIGKTYEMDGEIELCSRGFHFCEVIADCFRYYDQSDARFAKIEALGKVIESDEDSKCVTDKIKILEEIPIDEAIKMTNSGWRNSGIYNSGNYNSGNGNSGNGNSGIYNSGDCNYGDSNSGTHNSGNGNSGHGNSGNRNSGSHNSGSHNSGNGNSGNRNSGSHNSGDYNSGDWNKSSFNNGCFMSIKKPAIMMFNKPTSWTIEDWKNSHARYVMGLCPTKNRQVWWDELSVDDKQEVMSLPNFDADVFYECTGIKVKAEDE